jgi:hypothetical protein
MYFFKSSNATLDRQLWLSVKIAKCRGTMYLDQISLRRAFHHAGMWFRRNISNILKNLFWLTYIALPVVTVAIPGIQRSARVPSEPSHADQSARYRFSKQGCGVYVARFKRERRLWNEIFFRKKARNSLPWRLSPGVGAPIYIKVENGRGAEVRVVDCHTFPSY